MAVIFLKFSKAVDSQMLTFLLNEMSNYRTMSHDMQVEINELKSKVATLTSQNDHLQRMVTSLDSKTKHLEQQLKSDVSKLSADLLVVDKATNNSILFIQTEQKVFEQRIQRELENISSEFNVKLTFSTHDVVFSAYGAPGNILQHKTVIFSNTSINIPPSYDNNTGIYTVPEDGMYTLRMTDGIVPHTISNTSPFVVNNIHLPGCFAYGKSILYVCQIYVQLHAGDQVWIQDSNDINHTDTSTFSVWKM
ncbi:uncharacterized protein LOC133183822 [Saccostrea echinata]|uniref:uncharacterized protein LOC133183822 n=1 Tax=Saccostrea echinata TaxID=191078 RepID=UPI002A83F856|nr:uncharacterized protein LOC133183822 [Saccostrea echinata]